ncbi:MULTISPECIES: hypothetical protein [Rhizobium]|uniref:hypothetical protein n=1 Tax=Rhizobium terrae TaxID=2171756 RepID=UPI000E3DDF14|nr:hypothetical protein [Rhizobium terrae]
MKWWDNPARLEGSRAAVACGGRRTFPFPDCEFASSNQRGFNFQLTGNNSSGFEEGKFERFVEQRMEGALLHDIAAAINLDLLSIEQCLSSRHPDDFKDSSGLWARSNLTSSGRNALKIFRRHLFCTRRIWIIFLDGDLAIDRSF